MTTTLPPGVTLQQIDGGPTYYSSQGFTNAVNLGWDSPNFIPIGAWGANITSTSDAARWADLGWNTAFVPVTANQSVLQTNNISLVISVEPGWTSYTNYGFTPGRETVGIQTFDEPNTLADGVTTPLSTTPNSLQDGHFWWMNTTWAFASSQFGGLSPVTSSQQVLDTLVTTPDGTQRHIDIQSLDLYWFTSANVNWVQEVGGENIHNFGRPMTPDEILRGSNYGDMIDLQRALQTDHPAPIFGYVENGGPDTNSATAASYIQPPELNWAVWSELIHGARGVIYFNTTFGGPAATTYDDLASPYFQTIQPGQTISIYDQTKATDALVHQMAPELNAPFALNYVSTPGGYNYGSGFDNTLGGIETAAHFYNGQYYIFADTRDSLTQTNISATFTLNDPLATSVTAINENRTIPVANGAFSDTFANAWTVHIYQVNDGGSTSAPVVTISLANDTGVSSTDKITSNDALTGSADPNAVVTITQGTTTLGTPTANASGVWSFTPTGLADGQHTVVASETNSAGLTGTASLTFTLDTTAPTVSSISATTDSGATDLNAGHVITITETFSAPVYVTGTPTLQLNDNEVATYNTGSATNTLSFTYTVKAGDNVSDLMVTGLGLSGATITDVAGNPFSGPAQGDLHLQIDTTPPTVSSLSATSDNGSTNVTTNHLITVSLNASENLNVTGTPSLQLNDNEVATYLAGSGTNTLTFDYTVKAGDSTSDLQVTNLNLTGAAITDGAGNPIGTVQGDLHLQVNASTSAPEPTISSFGATISTTTLNGTGEPNSTITEFDGSTVLGTTTVNSSGAWTLTTGSLSAGTHNLTVTDVAGNTSLGSAPFAITEIIGTSGNDVLGPTGPGNYIVTGNGGADTFVFSGTNFGTNVITDFHARGGHHDVIQFNQTAFADFGSVQSHSAQIGSNVVITLDAADAVTLVGVTLGSLRSYDFHLV